MMPEDDWTVVTATDKKRVMRRSGRDRERSSVYPSLNGTNSASDIQITIGQSTLLSYNDPSGDDILCKCIYNCMDFILKSDLWTSLFLSIQQWVITIGSGEDIQVGKLVAYGIGNFSNTAIKYYSASLWQLALAFCLQKTVNGGKNLFVNVDFFDPCTTELERRFLQDRFGVKVLPTNDRGNYNVLTTVTIFLMPHCPSQLYENVVWSNYYNLHRIVFLGNSLRNLAERRSPSPLLCLHSLLPTLYESSLAGSRSDYKKAEGIGNFVGAWNDTYFSYFNIQNHSQTSRPYDCFNSNNLDMELL
jgi:SRR1